MSTRINRVPAGLLDFLATKSLGDNPSEFSGEVRPTLDLFPFFAAERLQVISRSESQATAGTYTFTVPKGQIWIPVAASMAQIVGNNNDICDMRIDVRNFPGGTTFLAGVALDVTIAAKEFTLGASVSTIAGADLSLVHQFSQLQAWGTDSDILFRWENTTFTTPNTMRAGLLYYRYTT